MVTLQMIQEAQESLKGIARKTPLENANRLGENIYIKSENLQLTGAFKIRGCLQQDPFPDSGGSFSRCHRLLRRQPCSGHCSVRHEAGHQVRDLHARGRSHLQGGGHRNYGAEVVLVPGVYDDAAREAERLSKEHGYTFAHPFNDPYVIAGQGTIGLEILEQLPEVEQVVVPIGGGGLISGVAFAIKQSSPPARSSACRPVWLPPCMLPARPARSPR